MRLVFLGQSCGATAAALAVLLEGDVGVSAVVLAGEHGAGPGEPVQLAAEVGVPLVRVRSAAEVGGVLQRYGPAAAVAACFPWRLPRAAREAPPLGILNIHPSPLPLGRGPEPVFWTLRRGEREAGATVHRMDAGFDTGPIVAQDTMTVPEGIRAPELEHRLMARGARLLIEALPALASGELLARPQPASGGTYAPTPSSADWVMTPLLPAAWAWRFARGVAPLGGPLAVVAGGEAIPVADALAWSPDEWAPHLVVYEGDDLVRVRFTPGWVRFRRGVSESAKCDDTAAVTRVNAC